MPHPSLLLSLAALLPASALADGHADAPGAAADPAADIASLFAWHTSGGKLVTVLTYRPFLGSGASPVYDADVLYGIHIDRTNDGVADTDLYFQFGQNGAGEWGVQATTGSAQLSGPVETVLSDGSTRLWAGPADDPYFFDLEGYQATVGSATLSFTGTDGLAGLNVMAITCETDLAALSGGATDLRVWATTGRK